MTIGQRVLSIIDNSPDKGISRAGLSKHLNTSKSTVSGWADENRNPSSNIIVPICEYLGVPLTFLLTGDEKKSAPDAVAPEADIDKQLLRVIHSMTDEQKRALLALVDSLDK